MFFVQFIKKILPLPRPSGILKVVANSRNEAITARDYVGITTSLLPQMRPKL